MKIGVVSDTHSRDLPLQMIRDFADVDFIIHAGDFCDIADYNRFAEIKPVQAVQGNMDSPAICKRFPRRITIPCERYRIGVFHGEGPRQKVLERVRAEFKGEPVDAVIFGHSHEPVNQKFGNTLYFNPGSPNDDISAPYCSYGILDISAGGISGKIVKVKK